MMRFIGGRGVKPPSIIQVSKLVADYLHSLSKDEELRVERNKRLEELFASQDRGRKRKPVGRLKREEIYGRGLR